MNVRFNDEQELFTQYPWLRNKDLWDCSTAHDGYVKVTDPEVPTFMYSGLYIHLKNIESVVGNTAETQAYIEWKTNEEQKVALNHTGISSFGALSGDYEYTITAVPDSNNPRASGGVSTSKVAVAEATALGGVTVGLGLSTASIGCIGYAVTSSIPYSWENKASEPEVELHMADLTMEDLIAEETAATTVIRQIKVVPDSPYWLALKGVAQVLGGLHLRFYKDLWSNLNCEEYRNSECLILASTKEIECSDVFQGQYVQSLKGLIIPSEFLE